MVKKECLFGCGKQAIEDDDLCEQCLKILEQDTVDHALLDALDEEEKEREIPKQPPLKRQYGFYREEKNDKRPLKRQRREPIYDVEIDDDLSVYELSSD